MSEISVFDVIGPVMVGPSSSHTAGAARMALMARKMMRDEVVRADITLYGSFAKTYLGHGTDRALAGGILGFETDDVRIRDSLEIARERGVSITFRTDSQETDIHPNTADILMEDRSGYRLLVRGESTGGGKARISRINGMNAEISGDLCSLVVIHIDYPGVLAWITHVLNKHGLNIATLRTFRKEKGGETYTVIESDDEITPMICEEIRWLEHITDTILMRL